MTILQKNSGDIWLVIDVRTAQYGVSSGISRFVTGITSALSSELSKKRKNPNSVYKHLKIMIISKTDPADWITSLVYKFPDVVCFWKCDTHGFFIRKIDKPTWLWPTLTLKKLQNMTGNKIIWFAPANFDRPLFISNNTMASRVIQVVHDSIPFLKLKGFGFLFKRQFKFLVARSLAKLSYVATVSQHSAQSLNALVKKRIGSIYIIRDAVEDLFGDKQKIFQKDIIQKERLLFFKDLKSDFNIEEICKHKWTLGIGRNQKYKCWDVAIQAIEKLNSTVEGRKILFIRVGADNKEINSYSKKFQPKDYGKIKFFEELNLIFLPIISDEQLALLYRISDLLVHPSLAEGFGLPPLEAALSGLPVVFRKGTAVDEHFEEGALPTNFWNAVDSHYSAVWANQIERILSDRHDSDFFRGLYESSSSRDYILNFTKSQKSFRWEDSANALLNIIGSAGGIFETAYHIIEKGAK